MNNLWDRTYRVNKNIVRSVLLGLITTIRFSFMSTGL